MYIYRHINGQALVWPRCSCMRHLTCMNILSLYTPISMYMRHTYTVFVTPESMYMKQHR